MVKKNKRQHCETAYACFMEGLFQDSYIWCPLAAPPKAPVDLQSIWGTDGCTWLVKLQVPVANFKHGQSDTDPDLPCDP